MSSKQESKEASLSMSEVSAVTSSTVSALCSRLLVDDGASASGGLTVHVSLETPSLRTGVSGLVYHLC